MSPFTCTQNQTTCRVLPLYSTWIPLSFSRFNCSWTWLNCWHLYPFSVSLRATYTHGRSSGFSFYRFINIPDTGEGVAFDWSTLHLKVQKFTQIFFLFFIVNKTLRFFGKLFWPYWPNWSKLQTLQPLFLLLSRLSHIFKINAQKDIYIYLLIILDVVASGGYLEARLISWRHRSTCLKFSPKSSP